MAVDLRTRYLGLELAHPFIVASSTLTATLDGVKKAAEHGASAIVLKSLFEEQISAELKKQENQIDELSHPEAVDYVQQMGMRIGPREYVELIKDAKKAVSIPVIASINCVSASWWTEYAKELELAGADALELNIGIMPQGKEDTASHIEDQLYKIIDKVVALVRIPVSVKLGPYFTSLSHVAHECFRRGVKGLVLFNRFYQLDISLEAMSLKGGVAFSNPNDYTTSLRWISILHGRNALDLCASTGIHDAQTALKLIASGASAVELCSTLYKNGYKVIQEMIQESSNWLASKGIASLSELKGKLSQKTSPQPEAYDRVQYIKALTGMY